MSQAITTKILDSLPLLDLDEKKSLLSVIQSFLRLKDYPVPDSERISLVQYNKEIEEALERVNAGEFYTQAEVEEMSKKW